MTPPNIDIQFDKEPGNSGSGHGNIDVWPLDDQQSQDLRATVELDGVSLINEIDEPTAGRHLVYGFFNTGPARLAKDAQTVEAAVHGLGLEVAPKEGITMAASPEYRKSNGFDGFNPAHLSLGERQNISARKAAEIRQDVSGIRVGFEDVLADYDDAEKAFDPPKHAVRTAELLAAGHLALEGADHEAISPGATVQHLPERPAPVEAPREHYSQAA